VNFKWQEYFHYLDFQIDEWFEKDADLTLSSH